MLLYPRRPRLLLARSSSACLLRFREILFLLLGCFFFLGPREILKAALQLSSGNCLMKWLRVYDGQSSCAPRRFLCRCQYLLLWGTCLLGFRMPYSQYCLSRLSSI